MSLLTIMQRAAKRTGLLESPGTVVGNSNKSVEKTLELLNEIGDNLVVEFDWQQLLRETTFATVASTQDYVIGTDLITGGDFDSFPTTTMWNNSNNKVVTLLTVAGWQAAQNQIGVSGQFNDLAWLNADQLSIFPTPNAVETISLVYKSNFWIKSSGGTAKDDWTVDTDTSYFKEDFLYLGLVAALKKEFGVPYFDDEDKFEKRKEIEKAKSLPQNTLSLTPDTRFPRANIPETGVGA